MDFEPITAFDEPFARQLHTLYQEAWWSRGRTIEQVRLVLEHSDYLFGYRVRGTGELAAFARVLTDRVFKVFIFDVIVASEHRGMGLGKRLIRAILEHSDLAGAKHFELYCLPELVPFYRAMGFTDEMGGIVPMRRQKERPSTEPI